MDTSIFSDIYINNNILPLYNLYNSKVALVKFKDTDKQRAVYKITHHNKIYCLKKVYFQLDELLFVYSALEWLYRNTFFVPHLLSSIYGEKYIKIENNYFILTPWLNGEKCDFDNKNHITLSAKALATMHKISYNFYPIIKNKKRIQNYNHYISTLKHFEELISISTFGLKSNYDFSKEFSKEFKTHLSLAEISLMYATKINECNLTTSLCHGDYVNKNIIIDNEKIAVIDFDKCKIGFIANDISYFLRRCLRREHTSWNINVFKNFINNYTSINPLSKSDLYFIISYLAFPQKFWKISKDYYFGKINNSNSKNIIKKLNEKAKYQLDFINTITSL